VLNGCGCHPLAKCHNPMPFYLGTKSFKLKAEAKILLFQNDGTNSNFIFL
jgi:hypothetical protein